MDFTIGVYGQIGPYGGGVGLGTGGVQGIGFSNASVGVSAGYYGTVNVSIRGVDTSHQGYVGLSTVPGLPPTPIVASSQIGIGDGAHFSTVGVGIENRVEVGVYFEFTHEGVYNGIVGSGLAQQSVGSARVAGYSGRDGIPRAGDELNALDALAELGGIAVDNPNDEYDFGDGDNSNDNDWRRPDHTTDGPASGGVLAANHQDVVRGSGGGVSDHLTPNSNGVLPNPVTVRDPYEEDGPGIIIPSENDGPDSPPPVSVTVERDEITGEIDSVSISDPSTGTTTTIDPGSGTPSTIQDINPGLVDGEYDGPYPIILDLDGDGIQVTELSQSNQFFDTTNSGLDSRIAWAAAGNGVLFFDDSFDPADGPSIRETRQFVFTEWDPTASSDIEALASVFDTNGDGELTGAELDDFYVLETMDDGSTVVRTMADLGVTSISVEPDATNITLPDGSVITGQTTYEFIDANGDTQERTLADVTLQAEAMGYRVEHAESVDSAGTRTQITTGYGLDGSVAFVHEFERSAGRLKVENRYDDNGDGVVDWLQVITTVSGGEEETVSKSLKYLTARRENFCCHFPKFEESFRQLAPR